MANRPIFIPNLDSVGVIKKSLEFKWHAGLSKSQKQKSIRELHEAARGAGVCPVLEISSKSEIDLGIQLSAFNLCLNLGPQHSRVTVETAFQGSKVFERGGPFCDLLGMDSRTAKTDTRLQTSGNLVAFDLFGQRFPLMPRTFFYDWLYLKALSQNEDLARRLPDFAAFSDIEFNPDKSLNCQASTAALYVSLKANGCLTDAMTSPEYLLRHIAPSM